MVGLTGIPALGAVAAKGKALDVQAASWKQAPASAATGDRLELSAKARALSAQSTEAAKPLPAFGQFQLGGAEPLPFGPDQNASILNRIPGDGVEKPTHGVQLGHQPARGLNILA